MKIDILMLGLTDQLCQKDEKSKTFYVRQPVPLAFVCNKEVTREIFLVFRKSICRF